MEEIQRPFYLDRSLWLLIFSNCVAIFFAVENSWSLIMLMTLYWVQSVIIGVFNVLRILSLKKFSTENVTINDNPVLPTKAAKYFVALFFSVHYGLFHLVYAVFLFLGFGGMSMPPLLFSGALFFVNHLFSFQYNRKRDEEKVQNIGGVMLFPYARIVPMHIAILFSGVFSSGNASLVLFLGLKTVADAVMHIIEHR
jgi:hypothetical protein